MSSDKIKDTNIVEEMNNSFLDYAMSVIVSRALPDVRDGLKPVHRRILYAMNDLGNTPDKAYKKSARIVGDVIGKYHPHGDSSVYEAMVRMSQEFSFRDPLIDGHGNFGSLDGDGAAAMRYTEARMSKLAMELLRDINKKTIDYQDNYDGSEREPVVMPARYPNLLVNGASGIAVGMATNIPPHNLGEVIDATIAYIDNQEITLPEIMQYIKGPDFPLGGEILGNVGIIKAYETGNGSIKVRAKYEIFHDKNGRATIIVTEIPFQVNKASLVEKIADCVKEKRIEGISDLRDESDRDGVRIVIELGRNVSEEVVINSLFKYTQLESSFAMNMLALVHGEPKVLPIKKILQHYVEHQVEVTRRKTQFDLKRAQDRAHILEGLKIALDNIDAVIKVIRGSETQEIAFNELRNSFTLSEIQAKSILEMQLRRLTGLERGKIEAELAELMLLIADLEDILANPERIYEIIRDSLTDVKARFETPRRSVIIEGYFDSSIDYEQLIEESNVIISLTQGGYIKRLSPESYRAQARGGKGTKGMNVNNEDVVTNILFASTHSDLLFFTDTGKVFKTRTHKVPEYSKTAKGLPLINLIDIDQDEKITKIISIKDYIEDSSLMIVTRGGMGKKTLLSEYKSIMKNGKRAISLNEGDLVQSVFVVQEDEELIISSSEAKALRCMASVFRPIGRTSRGTRALRLGETDHIVAADVVKTEEYIVTITEKGFGKATLVDEYRIQNRGGKGIKSLSMSEKTGNIIASFKMSKEELETMDILMMTKLGQAIRIKATDAKILGRSARGVTLMRFSNEDTIANVEIVENFEKNDDSEV